VHVFADIANALAFTPVIATPVMLRFALPLLLTITVIARWSHSPPWLEIPKALPA